MTCRSKNTALQTPLAIKIQSLATTVALVLTVLGACVVSADEAAEIRELVSQSNIEYAHNVTAGDLNDIQYRYSKDAWLIGHGGMRIQGRKAITNHLNEVITLRPAAVTVTTLSLEKAGDKYIELGESRGTTASGGGWFGHYMSIWVEQDGQWLIEKNIFNVD